MKKWSLEMDAAPEDREVLLACTAMGDADSVCRVLAQREWFEVNENERVLGWKSTLAGERLDTWLVPYAWCDPPTPPDPESF